MVQWPSDNHTLSASLSPQNIGCQLPPHVSHIRKIAQTTLTISRPFERQGSRHKESFEGRGFYTIHCSNSRISWWVIYPVRLHLTPSSTSFFWFSLHLISFLMSVFLFSISDLHFHQDTALKGIRHSYSR